MSRHIVGHVFVGTTRRLTVRWKSTIANESCLRWPLEKGVRLSSRLLDIERHWRDRLKPNVIQPDSSLPPKYVLAMIPYPSGRLHIGHLRVYSISDVCSRYYALNGYSTIHPIGWDAFGLPAENAAREHGADPAAWTKAETFAQFRNIDEMREQLKRTGIHFDWDRELSTCQPDFYRWTQWLFLRLYERGFVHRALADVFWDPVDETVLAAEQVDADGRSWRSGALVERRRLWHWVVETPKYAKRLADGLVALRFDWGEVTAIQANWIGRCDVYRFLLPVVCSADGSPTAERLDLRVFEPTDVLRARFILLTADHALAADQPAAEDFYVLPELAVRNPFTSRLLPLVVAPAAFLAAEREAVAADGSRKRSKRFVMDVRLADPRSDASDERLARRLGLSFDYYDVGVAAEKRSAAEILAEAAAMGMGGYLTSRTLRDWVVSRQRAWGTPIPMLLDDGEKISESAGLVRPVSYDRLPIQPEQRGQPMTDERGTGRLETDTLDTFFDSSWYFLRFLDPHNADALADSSLLRARMPIDLYVGGVEHADLHLFFARFVSHFLHAELGLLERPEPFRRLIPQGIVRGRTYRRVDDGAFLRADEVERRPVNKTSDDSDSTAAADATFVECRTGRPVGSKFEKMSKSKHNGVDPLTLVATEGVDLARLQLLDAAAPRQPINWGASQEADAKGLRRFLDRCAAIISIYIESRAFAANQPSADESIERFCRDRRNECTRKTSIAVDIINVHNTAIEALQIFTSQLKKVDAAAAAGSVEFERAVHALVVMLQLFAPHTAAELWSALATVPPSSRLVPAMWTAGDVSAQRWPAVDEDAMIDFIATINGVTLKSEVPRQCVESLTVDELVAASRGVHHTRLFELLAEHDVSIAGFHVERRPGLHMMLDIQLAGEVEEALINRIFERIRHEKLARLKSEKKRRQQPAVTPTSEKLKAADDV